MKGLGVVCAVVAALATWTPRAWADDLEVGTGVLALLSVDHSTRGGGVGPALTIGKTLLDRPGDVPVTVSAVGEVGFLAGGGLVWLARAGPTARLVRLETWQPGVGISLLVLGGGLVRTIDEDGKRADNPWSLQLGLEPLRFRLLQGWISVLRWGVGPHLLRSGNPPMTVSVSLFEVGGTF